jgi:sarcosine oxidase subunit alpha
LWRAVAAAGARFGITPYGTETMHVLRAEKGYPIVGQDTDGTITPFDLGMGWAVSKKKADFIGKRSYTRAENQRTDRKQLVGLLPVDRELRLAEGTQLIATVEIGPPPVAMLGFVTSSYRSAELGRTFALALVHAGRARIGTQIHAVIAGRTAAVDVVEPVFVDPEGARRDG